MGRRIIAVLGSASAAVALAAGAAETPQQRPDFRSGAVFVNVDAYPRRDGKLVEGLTRREFEIFEDGKPQSVEEFRFIRHEPFTPNAERRDPTSIEDANRQAADPRNRVFVIYFDLFHTTHVGAFYGREPVLTFLQRTIGPNDLFAIMTPELPASQFTFGRRTEVIEFELSKRWFLEASQIDSPRNQIEGQLWACGGNLLQRHREDLTASSLEQLVTRLGNLRDERKNVLFVTEGWTPRRASLPARAGSGRPSIPTIGVGPTSRIGVGPNSNMSGASDTAWCDAQSARLNSIDFARRSRDLLEMSKRANVAFYPLDLGGLRASAAVDGIRQATAIVDRLRVLADNTDGKAIVNTNDLVSGVRRIADNLSGFYLLGYYSNNPAADGKFRRIEVKVKARGIDVSARRGYLAPTPEIRKAQEEARVRPATASSAVDLELGRLARLRTDARVYTTAISTPTGLDVVVEIASTEFGTGRWATGADVLIRVSPKGDKNEVVVSGRLALGSRSVLIKVPSSAPDTRGWQVRSRVESGDERLEDEIVVSTPATSIIGDPMVFRGGAGPRSLLHPVADFRLFRTERIHIEWTINGTLDKRTVRLLNRQGSAVPIAVPLSELTDSGRRFVAADLVLGSLAAGDYIMELTANIAAGTARKLIAFRVVR